MSDYGRATAFDTTLVRVETDDGLIGWGEAKGVLPSSGAQAALVTAINEEMAPLLVGEVLAEDEHPAVRVSAQDAV